MTSITLPCPLCGGERTRRCRDCGGVGYSKHGHRPDDYGPHTKCQACGGTGLRPCSGCGGRGKVPLDDPHAAEV